VNLRNVTKQNNPGKRKRTGEMRPKEFEMITVDGALKKILENLQIMPGEEIGLTEGLGRVLAEDLYADADIPQLDNSAMDGYAVKSKDIAGCAWARPKELRVIEDIRAGYLASRTVGVDEAIRIMTGAPLPEGADSVVMVEHTQSSGGGKRKELVRVFKETKACENVRKSGEDIKKGELVARRGTRLNPAHIGVLASLGKARIIVVKKPKVAVLATGDEVIGLEEKMEPWKLRSSNTYTLCSQIAESGGVPRNLGIAKDEPDELEKKIKDGLQADIIVTSGGVSVGDYDFVKHVLAKLGGEVKFWQIAVRPGKPLTFGTIKDVPAFGLPGNPVSCMVSFENFVRPAILKMLGQKEDNHKEVQAELEETITKRSGLRYFLRARTEWKDGKYLTRTTGPQGSGMLKSMAQANSLIVLPEEPRKVEKGAKVRVKFLD